MNLKLYSYPVAFLKIFRFSNTRFDGDNIAATLWEQDIFHSVLQISFLFKF
jgi:hypothetical protein